ncbi:MAG TPA: hypothetical protein VEJ20_10365, partial [Candidatus Eremiobacteraceae bacterium]|nr:hypothetical protein [Candidatus Eremiobacteraceae bacterium]
QTDCLICSTFFRRQVIESGENPEAFVLDPWETHIVEFARRLATGTGTVPDMLFRSLSERLTDEQLVALTAFGCMMLATNVFNNALQVDLDEYLVPFRASADPSSSSEAG